VKLATVIDVAGKERQFSPAVRVTFPDPTLPGLAGFGHVVGDSETALLSKATRHQIYKRAESDFDLHRRGCRVPINPPARSLHGDSVGALISSSNGPFPRE